jgi:hypothetical protein
MKRLPVPPRFFSQKFIVPMHTSLPTLLLLLVLALSSCQPAQPSETATSPAESRAEAREDSLELVAAYARQAQIEASVSPDVETDAVAAGVELDAADDPALWLHPENPEQSLLFGSNKQGGIVAYDLAGKEKAYYEVGKINNIYFSSTAYSPVRAVMNKVLPFPPPRVQLAGASAG